MCHGLRYVAYGTEKIWKGIAEMKRLLHKLRVWLIKKPGGNYGPDAIRTVEIKTTCSEPISLFAESTVSEEFLGQIQLDGEKAAALDKALTHVSATAKTDKKEGALPWISAKSISPA